MTPLPGREDENPVLKSLNAAQRRAVTSKSSTVAILAGPGSGKTHTLTSRVVWLVQQAGYQPSDIIVATFTVKAAREMKERIGKVLGQECERKIVLGTFHSIARRYLSAYGKNIGLDPKFGIADDGDSKAIIRRICKRHDMKVDPAYVKSWISKKKAKGGEGGGGNTSKPGAKQLPDNPELIECYKEYQDQLARANLLDYDDLLVRCVELLQDSPQCVSNVQAVLIDEYQDTNGIQYDLMKLFAQERQRITIVGDPDQSIYGWRSAEIRNLYRLLRDYPETDEISLEENYRSSQAILNVSLNIIQQDKRRYQKVLLPVHTKGTQPVLRKLKSSAAEGDWVVSEIKRVVALFGDMLTNDDVAILLRSASLSRHLESALGKTGIAYRMIGGHKFYERKEIKVLLDYLRVVHQPDNNDAIARIINVPRRGIGETTVQRLLEEADGERISLWSLLRKHCLGQRQATTKIMPKMEQKLNAELLRIILSVQQQQSQMEDNQDGLVGMIEKLISKLDFQRYLQTDYPEDHEQRWANVQEFINLANDFVKDAKNLEDEDLPEIAGVDQVKSDSILGKFLANVALASDAQKDNQQDGEKKPMITISTIHAAKGLEWPVVFVPAVYTGSIPHSRAEDEDEERRLLYVAMTRAQALLYLSCPLYGSQGSMGNRVELSPFIAPSASKAFAKQGPSLDPPVLAATAKILGRELPNEQAILDKLPPMFPMEDNLFPIDPIDIRDSETPVDGAPMNYTRASKRPRRDYEGYRATDEEMDANSWHKEYSTTMEQSSNFTISSLPGFTSAGAHQATLTAAAAAAAEVAEKSSRSKQQSLKGTTRRATDQQSLLGFVTTSSKKQGVSSRDGRGGSSGADASLARYQAAAARSAAAKGDIDPPRQAVIDPSLAGHKLPNGKTLSRPRGPKIKLEEEDPPRKPYSFFSSSPTGPPADDDTKPTKEDKASKDGEEDVSHMLMPGQPASSFHATTFLAAGSRRTGGFRRPVGLGPPPGMSRLCKPFKPLTIARPSGPPPR